VIKQQNYGDLFINDQGVMFGRGEVWINGICADSGCKRFDVKVVTIRGTSYLDRNCWRSIALTLAFYSAAKLLKKPGVIPGESRP
jgi:hypothetical protein